MAPALKHLPFRGAIIRGELFGVSAPSALRHELEGVRSKCRDQEDCLQMKESIIQMWVLPPSLFLPPSLPPSNSYPTPYMRTTLLLYLIIRMRSKLAKAKTKIRSQHEANKKLRERLKR